MFAATLTRLRCPRADCRSSLRCESDQEDIRYAEIACDRDHRFPVLNGVAILVPEPDSYLKRFADVILNLVDKVLLPPARREVLEAAATSRADQWSVDSRLAISLYAGNQYLGLEPQEGILGHTRSPILASLLKEYWRDNPIHRLRRIFEERKIEGHALLEIGCNVGGALHSLGRFARHSLGFDTSFASVFQARRILNESPVTVRLPADRLFGELSLDRRVSWGGPPAPQVDFVVGDAYHPPVALGAWNIVLALNVVDIVRDPVAFVDAHAALAAPGGYLGACSPYLWHEAGAKAVREALPSADSSEQAVESLYRRSGTEILESHPDVPWIFFKHDRRAEFNSAHLIVGQRT